MTTLAEAAEYIYARFIANWDIDDGVYTFEGENFIEPADAPWLRLVIRDTDSGQETLGPVGNRKFERKASVITQIFTPVNQGISPGNTLAEAIRGIFEGVTFNQLYFFESNVRQLGVDGLWYQVVVESKFTYNETK